MFLKHFICLITFFLMNGNTEKLFIGKSHNKNYELSVNCKKENKNLSIWFRSFLSISFVFRLFVANFISVSFLLHPHPIQSQLFTNEIFPPAPNELKTVSYASCFIFDLVEMSLCWNIYFIFWSVILSSTKVV